MMQIKSFKIPTKSLGYFLICSLSILAFIALGIYPSQRSLGSMDLEISKIRSSIEEQNMLFPVYAQLQQRIQFKGSDILSSPVGTKLSIDKIEKLPSIFKKIAQKYNLTALSVAPDVMSFGSDSEFLLVNVVIQGKFFDFRKFLIELVNLAYLEQIEQIRIERADRAKKFNLKIWLAMN